MSVKKTAEVGSEELIFLSCPSKDGKNLLWMHEGFGAFNFGKMSRVNLK